ncbi:hypothetical protein COLO4_38551 [Corchorus olitorius]|uniref:F-box domain-containing protein n=1 Tax=Corchorus olitorius TaxID=93759 RepID=A0A1R3FU96_9ROSI|nr:hypothetical protein COLO4_38551 [Corchorus olitorius]
MSSQISPAAAAAVVIANNEDLLLEILLRVPAKPLVKFKSVSKQWLSLISSPQFCRSHTHRHRDNASLTAAALLYRCGTSHLPPGGFHIVPLRNQCSKLPCFDYLSDPDVEIVQSCNGLLLCRCIDRSYSLKYFVCNPTTKRFKMLSFPQLEGFVYAVNLAFDPLKSVHYKIIAIRRLLWVAPRFQIDIYSSKTDSWSPKVVNFTTDYYVWFGLGVFCNGAIHWDSHSGDGKSLYFDVENKCLKEMPMPAQMLIAPQGSSRERNRFFGESWGRLHLTIAYLPPSLQFNVFEMATDYSNWSLKYRVNLETVLGGFPEINLFCEERVNRVDALFVIRSEQDEVSKIVVLVNWKAIFYDLNEGTLTKLCDLEPCPKAYSHRPFYEQFDVFQYFESLACV